MKTFSHLWQYLAEFFLEWEMFQIKVVEKIKTHILCSVTFFFLPKIVPFVRTSKSMVEPSRPQITCHVRVACWLIKATRAQAHVCSRASSPTHTYITHAHKHTEICNIYCFSTKRVVSWTRLSVTLYVHCLLVFQMNVVTLATSALGSSA